MSSSQDPTVEDPPATGAMPDSGDPPPQQPPSENLSEKFEKMKISSSFSIWPPTQRTRDAVINRLIETLSTPSSVLSKRYGSMPHDEASSTAKAIEEEAYTAASYGGGGGGDAASSVDEGIEILQVYSKEISKRMLEAVKSRASVTVSDTPTPAEVFPVPETAGTGTSEEVSSGDNEPSA